MNDPKEFWSWFSENEARFRNIETSEKERLLDELLAHLHDYCESLWFEIGGHPNGPHELVITAEGVLKYSPHVRRLIAAAPKLEGWQFVAFRPAQGFGFTTTYEGVSVAPKSCWFMPLRSRSNPEDLGLKVAYSHFRKEQEKTFVLATYVMLDTAIGEMAVSEKIQHVEVCLAPSSPESSGFIPMVELLKYIEEREASRV